MFTQENVMIFYIVHLRSLISEWLTYEYYCMTSVGGVTEEMDVVADGLWGVAVVAGAVLVTS